MAFDYSGVSKKAKKLVDKFGRNITFVKLDEVVADPTKPWEGAATPRVDPESSITLKGVFVPPSSSVELGLQTIKPGMSDRAKQIIILAPGVAHVDVEFEQYDEVIDGTVRWKIVQVETLKPGSDRIVYFVEVER
jgi:hypothetical protein